MKDCPVCLIKSESNNTTKKIMKILDLFMEDEFTLNDISDVLLVLNGIDGYDAQSTTLLDEEDQKKKDECLQSEGVREGERSQIDIKSKKNHFIWKNVNYEYKRNIDSLVLMCFNVRHISRRIFENDKISIVEGKNLEYAFAPSTFWQKTKDVFLLTVRDILQPTPESKEAKRRKLVKDQESYDDIIKQLIENLN